MGSVESLESESPYLCVDLDGSLIKTDLLHESLLKLLINRPWQLLVFVKKLIKGGRASAKAWLAEQVEIEPETLPFNTHLLDYLVFQKDAGRKVILTTASNTKYAEQVAEHLGIFEDVIASSEDENLKGEKKLRAIKSYLDQEKFEYIGDSKADLEIWKEADEITVVSDNQSLIKKAIQIKKPKYLFSARGSFLRNLLKSLRTHQWSKNLLIFVPLIMAQQTMQLAGWLDSFIAFLSFSFCASGVYLLNDLLDLNSDRLHPSKSSRPLASGNFAIPHALLLFPILFLLGLGIAATLPQTFGITLLIYIVLTSLYSSYLKQVVVLDIIILAVLYSLRIFAGGAATTIPVSPWLIAFSMFLFLSLACLKRYIELIKTKSDTGIAGRGYLASDLSLVAQSGMSSGFISVLVLALYVNSPDIQSLYPQQQALWFLCPVFLYWLFRIWILAHREEVEDDPIVFALRDKVTYLILAIVTSILFFAAHA